MTTRKSTEKRAKMGRSSDPAATREALLDAAQRAFEESGFDGTDTNRIARAAGYSPQTFYRHFAEKMDVFVSVYERWVERQLDSTFVAGSASEAAATLLREHKAMSVFRRDLRRLAISNDRVRAVRARERQRQLERLRERFVRARSLPLDMLAIWLLCSERIADAIVDDELLDLGISKSVAQKRMVELIGGLDGAAVPATKRHSPFSGFAEREP